jgi:ribosome biogenesis GTPase / thiamine phosphate phosphatase
LRPEAAPARTAGAHHDVPLDTGLVIAGHGRHYLIETPEGGHTLCHPRGKKSDCVVGDRVRWQPTNERGDEGVIEHIEARRNLLYRQDEWRTKSFAANIDRLLVLVAADPPFGESQLARALIAADAAGIAALIVLNKADLGEPAAAARERLAPYRAMGYTVLDVSLKHQRDSARAVLDPWLLEGATLVLGPSGAGKSTLINLFVPSAGAQIGEISRALNAGRHTTTHTRWYWLDDARRGALIDSPGFQEFGLHHIGVAHLPHHMPDLRGFDGQCRFYNCTHVHEPGCAVLAAVQRGEVAASRHRLYVALREELSRARW